jgi:dTDP-4-amino-4,6-dideoxygalactose transaminase
MTHTATAHAVELVGAKPVFVDCDPASGNLTADRIERAITPHTKAISVVHFLGIPCEMPSIMLLAERHGLKVIEDCALAVGTRYDGRHVGLFGNVGCFSFYPVKHITTGEGGMFVTRHGSVAKQVTRLRGFGVDRAHQERIIPGMYDVPQLGLNYRMSELHAALGRAQMRRIKENLSRRRTNFETIKKALESQAGIQILESNDPRAENSHYCISLVLDEGLKSKRKALVESLVESGIGTSVYYPHPVPRLRYYADKYGYDPERFQAASTISDSSVALPVGPHLDESDVEYITETVVATLKELKS